MGIAILNFPEMQPPVRNKQERLVVKILTMFVASAVLPHTPATQRHNTTGFSSNLIPHTLHALEVKVGCPSTFDNSPSI
jgi:hypothetical protein